MQAPVPTSFMSEGESIPPLDAGALIWVEAFVDENFSSIKPNCTKNIGRDAFSWYIEDFMKVIEIDPQLQMFLYNVFDWNGRHESDIAAGCIFCQQSLRVALNISLGNKGHS